MSWCLMHRAGERELEDVQAACSLPWGHSSCNSLCLLVNLWTCSGMTLLVVSAHKVLLASGAPDSSQMFVINTDVVSVPICSTSLISLGCCEDKYLKRLSQMGHQSNGDHKSNWL